MCCKWLSCQWRSHASMARVNTVRCGLFDESVFFHNSESRVSYCSHVNKSVIPFCGQMFMNTPTHNVLHPLSRRAKGEFSHILSTKRQVSPKSHHSLTCFIKHKHSAAIKAKVKGILQKELSSLLSMPNTHKRGTRYKNHVKTHCSPLLRCCGGLPLMGSTALTNTMQEM